MPEPFRKSTQRRQPEPQDPQPRQKTLWPSEPPSRRLSLSLRTKRSAPEMPGTHRSRCPPSAPMQPRPCWPSLPIGQTDTHVIRARKSPGEVCVSRSCAWPFRALLVRAMTTLDSSAWRPALHVPWYCSCEQAVLASTHSCDLVAVFHDFRPDVLAFQRHPRPDFHAATAIVERVTASARPSHLGALDVDRVGLLTQNTEHNDTTKCS